MKAWMYEVKYYRIYRLENFSWWQLKRKRRTEKSLSDDCQKTKLHLTVLVEGTKS